MKHYGSWGRFPKAKHFRVIPVHWRHELPDFRSLKKPVLPYGQGRSYGDCCLNEEGFLIDTSGLCRFVAFDEQQGVLRCEAGVTLYELLQLTVPKGWFLSVTPGTQFVSVGGAIANDIHGKNHHCAGTFGRYVLQFELARSDGQLHVCSRNQNSQLYEATIGGMGLTGLILWAELQLKRVQSPYLIVEEIPFGDLQEFFELSADSDRQYEYTVAWVDCLARGRNLGRGVFFRGNHESQPSVSGHQPRAPIVGVPCDMPSALLNRASVELFNRFYFHRSRLASRAPKRVHYQPFFYPLDLIRNWNRLYGSRGFLQYQCVVSQDTKQVTREILDCIGHSGEGTLLAVLKTFGRIPSPGKLSFPRPGVTLALDFPYRGQRTLKLLDVLDDMVQQAGGAVYPAKDARMTAEKYQAYFPEWKAFSSWIDPKFSSSFWRRVTGSSETVPA
jgi:FAD/FMN-containing dehydrogenase